MLFRKSRRRRLPIPGEYLTDPIKVEEVSGKAADKVEQYVHFVGGKNDKTELLKKSLSEIRMAARSCSCAPSTAPRS